jgi:hypothetical protein
MVFEDVIRINMREASKSLAFRWTVLLAVLPLELIMLTARYEAPPLLADDGSWPRWLFHF